MPFHWLLKLLYVKVEYFFEPNRVRSDLEDYEHLNRVFSNPNSEGRPTTLTGVRKSPICIFDWFGGYDFQKPLCKKIDHALKSGWISKRDVCTTDFIAFESLLTEVDLMIYFEKKGYLVSRPPLSSQNHRADILLKTETSPICIEVFHPRFWAGYEAFRHELEHHVRLIDVPFNFSTSFHYELIERYGKMLTDRMYLSILILTNFRKPPAVGIKDGRL